MFTVDMVQTPVSAPVSFVCTYVFDVYVYAHSYVSYLRTCVRLCYVFMYACVCTLRIIHRDKTNWRRRRAQGGWPRRSNGGDLLWGCCVRTRFWYRSECVSSDSEAYCNNIIIMLCARRAVFSRYVRTIIFTRECLGHVFVLITVMFTLSAVYQSHHEDNNQAPNITKWRSFNHFLIHLTL